MLTSPSIRVQPIESGDPKYASGISSPGGSFASTAEGSDGAELHTGLGSCATPLPEGREEDIMESSNVTTESKGEQNGTGAETGAGTGAETGAETGAGTRKGSGAGTVEESVWSAASSDDGVSVVG